jgi:predicted enzyme related to lactoylglutathione lyase
VFSVTTVVKCFSPDQEHAMHKSKLAGFIIDCQTDDLPAAAAFWSAALGMPARALPAEEGGKYIRLDDPREELHVEVQKVSHPSRVHLDIESDDVEAEAARLEKLGARRIEKIHTWWVMEAPTGQRFCVVRKASRDFDRRANTWS